MVAAHRLLVIGAACAALCGCGSSAYSSQSGTAAAATTSGTSVAATGGFDSEPSSIDGTHDQVVSTPQSSLVSVEVGTHRTVSITFTSSDGRTITGFGLTSGSGAALPAGWSGPQTFGCAALSTGSGCVLNLTFTPTAYEIGQTLTLDYVFVDNSTEPVIDGSTTLAFQATTNDNVLAALSSTGQVNATIGAGSQTVTATFTTDDGHPATAFAVTTDAASLPAGWSGPAVGTCDTVSDGSACQLSWEYTPSAPGNGTLTIDYSFADDSGTSKVASFNVPYAATANDNVVYPAVGPITAAANTSRTVTVIFTTDDGFQATGLNMDLSALGSVYVGWSAASNAFSCDSISTGTGCELSLTFAPTAAAATQTLTLPFSYADNAGTLKTGSLSVVYTST